MNLFDNILNQSKNKFLGTQPSVPSVPSFATPQAPRTVNYTAPQVQQKPSMTLFSDEQKMFQKMKADNLDDNTAYSMLKKRRMDILGGNDLGNDEKEMLLKMQADNVPVKQAVSMIQQRRKDQFNKKYEEGNLLQKGAYNTLAFAAGNLETLAKYSGNTLDFITGGTMGFGDDVKAMEQVTQSPEFDSTAFKAGTYAPDVALAVSPIGGGYLAGAKGMGQLALRSGVVGAGFGATNPIMNEGSDATIGDIATGAAVGGTVGAIASPVLSKVLKYGQAGYRGGLEGVGKSITRDLKSGVQAITPSGANISTKANRFNANEIREFTKTTGQSPGDFATSRGMTKVGDDAVMEATSLWQKSKDQADEALKAIKGRFRFTDEGEDLLKTTIDDLETRLANTKSPDAKRISQLKAKYEDSGLSMSEINEIKRAYSNNYKYSFVDAGSESALRSKNLQDAVRKWQFKVAEENGLTNLKDINKTTQGWKMFADSLSKKIQGSSGNNNVSLTDWIALSGGGPENIALYLGKKLASSDTVKSGAIKLFSKKTKPSIIQASKADIQQANFKKDVNRGVSGVGDNSGGKSLVKPVGLIEAPKGQATGAKNFRVNQPKEAPAQKSDITSKSKIVRPGTKSQAQVKEEVQLAKQAKRQSELKLISDDIASATERARYGGTGNTRIETQLNGKMDAGKMTREEAIDISTEILKDVQEKGVSSKYKYIDRPKLESYINDLYSNKKMPTFDDLLNKPIVKPNTIKNESKVNKPTPSDTIPEGYFKNAFGEIQKNPSNKKGGFINIPEIGKKVEIDANKFVKSKNPDITLTTFEGPDEINLYRLEIPKSSRKEGKGTKAMADLIEYADKNGKRITLTPDNYAGSSISRLKEFYKRFGFVENTGRNKDFSTRELMYRTPKLKPEPKSTTTNVFGETIDKPSNKKGGFIKIPEIGKKIPIKNPLVEEARKYKSAEEFIKAVGEGKVKTNGFNISSDRFFGKNANISFGNVREISKPDLWRESSKYRETVDYWKEQIKKGERPVVQVSYADKNTKMIKGKTFKVTDGNHRLQAYKELGIKDIPIERFSDDGLVLKKELTELYKKLNPQ